MERPFDPILVEVIRNQIAAITEEMTLTVWRGDKMVPITVTAPKRYLGVELRSYPVEGWRER